MCSESQKMMAVKLIFWIKRIIDFEDRDVNTRLFLENNCLFIPGFLDF